jgi:hypothetical protein
MERRYNSYDSKEEKKLDSKRPHGTYIYMTYRVLGAEKTNCNMHTKTPRAP